MKKVLAVILILSMLFCVVGCDNAKTEVNTVGQSFVTDDFVYTVTDFQFVNAVSMGEYDYDIENIVSEDEASGDIIAAFKFEIENNGSETINLVFSKPVLVADDIIYDGLHNGESEFYCVTTQDNDFEISPLSKKEYNYCIFNVPASFMKQPSIELKFEIYGEECIYKIK